MSTPQDKLVDLQKYFDTLVKRQEEEDKKELEDRFSKLQAYFSELVRKVEQKTEEEEKKAAERRMPLGGKPDTSSTSSASSQVLIMPKTRKLSPIKNESFVPALEL